MTADLPIAVTWTVTAVPEVDHLNTNVALLAVLVLLLVAILLIDVPETVRVLVLVLVLALVLALEAEIEEAAEDEGIYKQDTTKDETQICLQLCVAYPLVVVAVAHVTAVVLLLAEST